MQNDARHLSRPLWRQVFVACAVGIGFVVTLLGGMATDVVFGQSRPADRVTKPSFIQWSPSVVLTTPTTNQLYLPLINTKPVPKQRIPQIDDVTVMVLGDDPPRLRITAYGTANADGWCNPELVLRSAPTLPMQDIPAFDFIAQPPTAGVLPMLKPMSATYELKLAPLVSGVRIYGLNNAKETHIEGIGHANVLLEPRTPHAGDDLQVIVHGIWYDGCVPSYQAHQLNNSLIPITTTSPALADPAAVCGQTITPWNFAVAVGALSAGAYTVTVGGAVTATTSFTVADPATP